MSFLASLLVGLIQKEGRKERERECVHVCECVRGWEGCPGACMFRTWPPGLPILTCLILSLELS